MKIALVVQRYGAEINGGAELHARWIAEMLSKEHEVTVFTTCAKDYLRWDNYYGRGVGRLDDIEIRRFRVRRARRGRTFIAIQNKVFFESHTEADERRWFKENGPYAPGLTSSLRRMQHHFDWILFFSFRYFTTFNTLPLVKDKAVLIPTAEEDPVISFEIMKSFFQLPRAIIYNSVEEREMIHHHTGNSKILGDVVGVGIKFQQGNAERFRQVYGIHSPYILYVGRVDKNKGCDRLVNYYLRYLEQDGERMQCDLVLVGGQYMTVPEHPRIKCTGFVSEQDKFDAIAGAECMVIPSPYESLCMALLECWAGSKAALVNGRCNVLQGQVKRANGGLYYNSYPEFRAALTFLMSNPEKRRAMGRQGHSYYQRNYNWSVIRSKYTKMLGKLSANKSIKK